MTNNEHIINPESPKPSLDTFRATIIRAIPRLVFAGALMTSLPLQEVQANSGDNQINSNEVSTTSSQYGSTTEFENGEQLRTILEEKLLECKNSPLCLVKLGRYNSETFLEISGIPTPILIQIDSSATVQVVSYPYGLDKGAMYVGEGSLLDVIDVLKHFISLMGREVI